MNTQSDTPETDEIAKTACFDSEVLDHARKMERERNDLKKMIRGLQVQLTKALEQVARDHAEKTVCQGDQR